MTTELINPHGDIEVASKLCSYIDNRKNELAASADELLANITAMNWNDPQNKAAIDDLSDAVEDLRESGKKLVQAVCAESEAQRIITQIDSRLWSYSSKADPNCAYAMLADKIKAIKVKVAAFKASALPPVKPRSFVLRIDATDAQIKKVCDAAVKAGAVVGACTTPQSDKAVRDIQKWFEANI